MWAFRAIQPSIVIYLVTLVYFRFFKIELLFVEILSIFDAILQSCEDALRQAVTGYVSATFAARRYASAICAMALCPSVCLSVTSRILSTRLNTASYRERSTIARGLCFSDAKTSSSNLNYLTVVTPKRAPDAVG